MDLKGQLLDARLFQQLELQIPQPVSIISSTKPGMSLSIIIFFLMLCAIGLLSFANSRLD